MQVLALDHINIHTADAAALAQWYVDVLGFEIGDRPNFPGIKGVWLYAGQDAMIHLVETPNVARAPSPQLEHFSLRAAGYHRFLETLNSKGIEFHIVDVEGFDIVQVNIEDADGNHLHVDFTKADAQAPDQPT